MRTQQRLDQLGLFLAAFLILVPGAFWGLPAGKNVAGALVILDGGVPYRDFWSMYAPGQFYAVAALYAVFGRELVVQAIAASVATAVAAVMFFGLLRRLEAGRLLAWALSALFVGMFWTTAPELTDYQLALPFLLAALSRAVQYYASGDIAHLRWAGVWLGVAAWSKHDVSAYIAMGLSISLVASATLPRNPRPDRWMAPARPILTVAAAALLAVAPMASWTAWSAGAAAWNDLVVFPATVFSKVRGDLFPPLVPDSAPVLAWLADPAHVRKALRASEAFEPWITLRVPMLTFVAGLALIASGRRRVVGWKLASVVMFVACMPFFWAAAHVQHNTHPYTLAVLCAGIGVVGWSWVSEHPAWRRRLRLPIGVGVVIYAAGLMTAAAVQAASVYYQWPGSRILELPGFRGIRVPARLHESFPPVGEFVRRHVPEGEPIYTGLLRHDSIVINNSLLYALAGRPACCGYTELHPGVGDREPVHHEIIRRLEEKQVRVLVLWEFGASEEYMERRKRHTMAGVPDAGSTILDRYIAERFEPVAQHGEYHILWRRGAPRSFP